MFYHKTLLYPTFENHKPKNKSSSLGIARLYFHMVHAITYLLCFILFLVNWQNEGQEVIFVTSTPDFNPSLW